MVLVIALVLELMHGIQHGFDVVQIEVVQAFYKVFGSLAGVVGGFDKIFKSRHSVTTIVFGVMMLIGLVGICYVPANSYYLTALFVSIFGFGLGVILCFVGGLLAVDLCPRKATGAAMGVIGLLAYGGSAAQDLVNGFLMDSAKVVVNGVTTYHFGTITTFWIASVAIMTILIVPTLWAKRVKHDED